MGFCSPCPSGHLPWFAGINTGALGLLSAGSIIACSAAPSRGGGSGTVLGLEQFAPGGRQLLAIYGVFEEVPWKRV